MSGLQSQEGEIRLHLVIALVKVSCHASPTIGEAAALLVISVCRGALSAPGHLPIVAFEKLDSSRLGILRRIVGVAQMSGDDRAFFQEQQLPCEGVGIR